MCPYKEDECHNNVGQVLCKVMKTNHIPLYIYAILVNTDISLHQPYYGIWQDEINTFLLESYH